MVWRQPEAVLNEPEPSESELNSCFLDAIRKCPSRVRPFPEHLLVLLGISKLWDKSNRDPILMRDGQVTSALDFVKSDDTSDVVFLRMPRLQRVRMQLLRVLSKGSKVLGSEGGVDKEKEKELVVAGKKKKLVKKGDVLAIQG
ncbi:hypothetical protein Hdeb2414_s0004g00127271 [Helianthus debilis subsp. tardiflorus]